MNELALFAGAGGGILGGVLLGWRTVCAVEFDEYARNVIIQRQNDGCLAPFPIWDDVRTFDGWPWRGCVDVVSGGFPCQDISCAGRGAGITGSRSGLWSEMFRIICEVGPRFVFVENSPMLTSRGLGRVLGDLASVGFDAEWMVLGADDVGAPHRRKRIWILADSRGGRLSRTETREVQFQGRAEAVGAGAPLGHAAKSGLQYGSSQQMGRPTQNAKPERPNGQMLANPDSQRGIARARIPVEQRQEVSDIDRSGRGSSRPMAHAERLRQQGSRLDRFASNSKAIGHRETGRTVDGGQGWADWWASEPNMGGVADGLASGLDLHGTHAGLDVGRVAKGIRDRVGRLKALGNGQVPACAASAFLQLMARSYT